MEAGVAGRRRVPARDVALAGVWTLQGSLLPIVATLYYKRVRSGAWWRLRSRITTNGH